ncbi:MAG: RNA polymerase sigma factor [Minisyncoccia bacterium]
MPEISDNDLIKQYLKGEEKALEVLIQRYLKLIYSFIYHYIRNETEAEDLTQEVFIKVWRNIKRFDPQKKFSTWILTIAKNTTFDFLRKKKPLLFSDLDEKAFNNLIENLPDLRQTPDEVFASKEKVNSMDSVLQILSPKEKTIFTLHFEKQLSFREIAESLGESINTVKSRYRRTIVSLKEKFTKEELQ